MLYNSWLFAQDSFVTLGIFLWCGEGVDEVTQSGKTDASLSSGARTPFHAESRTATAGANYGIKAILAISNNLASSLQTRVNGANGSPGSAVSFGLSKRAAERTCGPQARYETE